MNIYRVNLRFMQGHVSGLPTIDVEAGSEVEAAALGFNIFAVAASGCSCPSGKCQSRNCRTARSYHRDVVIAWLHAPPRRRFVEDHALGDALR